MLNSSSKKKSRLRIQVPFWQVGCLNDIPSALLSNWMLDGCVNLCNVETFISNSLCITPLQHYNHPVLLNTLSGMLNVKMPALKVVSHIITDILLCPEMVTTRSIFRSPTGVRVTLSVRRMNKCWPWGTACIDLRRPTQSTALCCFLTTQWVAPCRCGGSPCTRPLCSTLQPQIDSKCSQCTLNWCPDAQENCFSVQILCQDNLKTTGMASAYSDSLCFCGVFFDILPLDWSLIMLIFSHGMAVRVVDFTNH